MEYEPTIGIETHAQLLTASKMFCPCSASYASAPPNSLVCPVCLGMPGALPVINRRAIEYVVMTGLALNCRIAEFSKFDRKNYSYPDLVKGYQISQYDLPLCRDGRVDIRVGDQTKRIRIERVHLEEDTGKLVHAKGTSLIDFNRSGMPLMEIVTEPDFVSIQEVREYVLRLRRVLCYLGVNSGNMEEGALRFEANVSVRPIGTVQMGIRIEVKNLNSLKAVLRSLEYEITRQQKALIDGGTVSRETRGWDKHGASPLCNAAKNSHTITGTFQNRICPRWRSHETGWNRSKPRCQSYPTRGVIVSWHSTSLLRTMRAS